MYNNLLIDDSAAGRVHRKIKDAARYEVRNIRRGILV